MNKQDQIKIESSGDIRLLVVGEQCTQALKSAPWTLERFHVRHIIGRGYASSVYECLDRVSNTTVALKVYRKEDLCPLNFHQLKREMLIQSNFRHPNILAIYAAFDDIKNVYMVLEYAAKGDLYNYLRHKGRRLSECQAAKYVIEPFLRTLRYIHANDVIHRDIKPENLLLSASGSLKLADFGLSIMHSDEHPVTRVGTVDYMAPEVVNCPRKRFADEWKDRLDLVYGPKVDVWAIGVLIFELIMGWPPFKGSTKDAVQDNILNAQPSLPDCLSLACQDFIMRCLQKDSALRPSVEELMSHPWISAYVLQHERQQVACTFAGSDSLSSASSSVGCTDNTYRYHTCGAEHSDSLEAVTTTSCAVSPAIASPRLGEDPHLARLYQQQAAAQQCQRPHLDVCRTAMARPVKPPALADDRMRSAYRSAVPIMTIPEQQTFSGNLCAAGNQH